MEVFTLENLPEEIEIETKMQYFLPGEDRDGGIYWSFYLERQRQKSKILYLERTKMETVLPTSPRMPTPLSSTPGIQNSKTGSYT